MTKKCLNCDRTENEIPLMTLAYREETLFICPQCLPVLIHKPQDLAGKLEGAENFPAGSHEH
jgi:hypothetical protein